MKRSGLRSLSVALVTATLLMLPLCPAAWAAGADEAAGANEAATSQVLAEGRHTFRFDTFGDEAIWGDTVKLASRMESGGIPDTIQVTRPVHDKLKDEFVFESRGAIEVKGKGQVEAWLLRL